MSPLWDGYLKPQVSIEIKCKLRQNKIKQNLTPPSDFHVFIPIFPDTISNINITYNYEGQW